MNTFKKIFVNLKPYLWFLLSFLGIFALAYGTEKGMRKIVFLVFVACCCGLPFMRCPFLSVKELFRNKKAVLLAAAVEFSFLLNFYNNFTPTILQRIAMAIHLPVQWLYVALGVFFCIIGFYATCSLSLLALRALRPIKAIVTRSRKQLLFLGLLFSISILAIVRANYNYIDDLGRLYQGYQISGSYSRYIASFMAAFLHSNAYLADISPLPQFLAAWILAVAAVILFAVVTDDGKLDLLGMLALIPVGTFPMFLQCYSYKYDAPYMAFSVLAAVLPLVYRKKGFVKFFLAVLIGTVLVCTTYQAASGIFPLVTVAVCLQMWKQNTPHKNTLVFLGSAVSGFVLGMGIFRFLIMDTSTQKDLDTGFSLSSFLPNLKEYLSLMGEWFAPVWVLLVIIIACGFIWTVIRTTQRNKIVSLILSICAIVLMSVLSFGAYLFLEVPLFYPRAMYGLGIAIAVWCIHIAVSNKLAIGQAAIALLALCFFSFSFTYGNALNMQNEHTHFRLEQVLSDVKNLDCMDNGNKVTVRITGTIGHPDHLETLFEEWPLLDKMVSVQLSDSSWYWGDFELLHFYGMNDVLLGGGDIDLTQYDLPILVDNPYHTIRGNDQYLLIELK